MPEIEKGRMLVRNRCSLISPGTELALFNGTHIGFSDPSITWARYPVQPGYAAVGVVEEVREDESEEGSSSPQPGDTVLYYPPHARYGVLDPRSMIWSPFDGPADERHILFGRFAQIAYTSVASASVDYRRVLVIGAGIVGNLTAQLFKRAGADQVIISDLSERRLDIAHECGIEYVLPPDKSDSAERLRKLTEEQGVDIVVEATGVPEIVRKALEYVNPGGEVILLGSSRGAVELNVYSLIHRKYTRLTGAHEMRLPEKGGGEGDKVTRSRESVLREMVEAIASEELKVGPMFTHRIYPREVQNAYEQLSMNSEEYMGVVIDWTEEEMGG
jgi:2-desacetyl-2-hydroxyethyl bacteriochlorophyllide A dehydrogenase